MPRPRLPASNVETLPNGLEVLVIPGASSPVVSVQAWVRAGSVHEQEFLGAGISHLLEHLVFKGTRSFGIGEAARAIQEAGGYLNAYTSFERTVYWVDAPSEGLATALDVTGDLVFYPLLPEEEFEREKEVIRREIAMGKDDPRRVFSEQLFATAFREHPCRHPVIGHLGAFNRLTLADVRAYHARHYVPNNVFFVIAGDVDVDEAVAMVRERFGELAPSGRCSPVLPDEPELSGPREKTVSFTTDLARLQMAWHVPAHGHPDIPALDVLARILGGGESSRLFRRLREEQELAHEVGSGIYSPGFSGVFYAGGETEIDRLAPLEEGILNEITKLRASGVTPAELEKARRGALADFLHGLESTQGLASQVAASWLLSHSTDYPERYLQGLQSVDAATVVEVATRYLLDDRRVTVRMLPHSAPKPRPVFAARPSGSSLDLETLHLPNGMTVLLGRDPRLPIVSTHFFCLGGSSADAPEMAGLSTWLANGLWKGTGKHDGAALAEAIEGRGGSFGAMAGNLSIGISLDMLADDFPMGCELLAEVAGQANFPLAAMERERAAMIAAARDRDLQPLPSAMREARARLFAGTGFAHPSAGTVESLAALRADSLPAIWQGRRAPTSSILGVFGDFDPDDAAARLTSGFGNPTEETISSAPSNMIWPGEPMGGVFELRRPKEQAVLVVVYPTDGLLAADATALDLLDEACGDMASRFFLRIREEQGLAYFVAPFQLKGTRIGGFGFYLGTSADKLDHAEAETLDEARRLATEGPDSAEIERARHTWRGKHLLQNQSIDSRGRQAAINALLGLGADYAERQLEEARKLPVSSVAEAAARVFSRPPVIVRVRPGE
ncbi:MAG: M16 family metallopeptidase [Verrucomicrobiales bacterium]